MATAMIQASTSKQRTRLRESQRWAAVMSRDRRADGAFVYAVKTTGVYCRPSCAARRARRENVCFFDTFRQAEQAGYRACLRCRPDETHLKDHAVDAIVRACRMIEAAREPVDFAKLASDVGLSRFHFQRLFKAQTGLTPREYAAARRITKVRKQLNEGAGVTRAIYAAGYNAPSRFYDVASKALGMSATAYRSGGAGATIRFAIGQCTLGSILVAGTARGICAISLGDDPELLARELQDRFPRAEVMGADAEFERWVAKVVGLVEAPRIGLDLPLDVRGTAFQHRVWRALCELPAGTTTTYARLAGKIGMPRAVRAVANACAANRLAVAIPCHRVVRCDGSISGYRWGIQRKRELLARERS